MNKTTATLKHEFKVGDKIWYSLRIYGHQMRVIRTVMVCDQISSIEFALTVDKKGIHNCSVVRYRLQGKLSKHIQYGHGTVYPSQVKLTKAEAKDIKVNCWVDKKVYEKYKP